MRTYLGLIFLLLFACTGGKVSVKDLDDCVAQSEVCNGVDDDCDGEIDEGVTTTFVLDADGDGCAAREENVEACESPGGDYSEQSDIFCNDCDDSDAAVNPFAEELCSGVDDDCDGLVDGEDDSLSEGSIYYIDVDGDGFGSAEQAPMFGCVQPAGYVSQSGDCDDADASVHPDVVELCNDVDDDCDGEPDNGLTFLDYFQDDDADGFGDAGDVTPTNACSAVLGEVADNTDCDDMDPGIHPGASELCDAVDRNCDGQPGELDADGDSFAGCAGDCNDANAAIHPNAEEVCNGVDDDCDGLVPMDEIDNDGDGFNECSDGDCNDSDPLVYVGALEVVADAIDQDCDAVDLCYQDLDGDGYGHPSNTVVDDDLDCTNGSNGESGSNDDCDDANSTVHPNATEVCNGIDDDCDGGPDNGLTFLDYYSDNDGDGFGDAGDFTPTNSCTSVPGEVTDHTDCDDSDPLVYVGALEVVADAIDQDCDAVDLCYQDSDGDGHGHAFNTIVDNDLDCSNTSNGEADVNDDCDDTDGGVWSGEMRYLDGDGDGYGDPATGLFDCPTAFTVDYVVDNTDCRDDLVDVNPGAAPNEYTVWDMDCSGTDDKAGQTYTTSEGDVFTFDVAAVNLFSDEEGDSTFIGGFTNWTWYVNDEDPLLIGYAGNYTTATYSTFLNGVYDAMELPHPVAGQGVDDMCLISTPVTLAIGGQYAACMNVESSPVDNQALRLYTKSSYDAGKGFGYYIANPTITGGVEFHVCGAFTATTTTEQILVCTGNWTTAAGAATHVYVGEGVY